MAAALYAGWRPRSVQSPFEEVSARYCDDCQKVVEALEGLAGDGPRSDQAVFHLAALRGSDDSRWRPTTWCAGGSRRPASGEPPGTTSARASRRQRTRSSGHTRFGHRREQLGLGLRGTGVRLLKMVADEATRLGQHWMTEVLPVADAAFPEYAFKRGSDAPMQRRDVLVDLEPSR